MLRVNVNVKLDVEGKSLVGKVCGWRLGKSGYLIVEITEGSFSGNLLKPKSITIIRFENDGVLYGLKGVFLQFIKNYQDIAIFMLSEEVMQNRMRDDERINCMIPFTIHDEFHKKQISEGLITDISPKGIEFTTLQPLPVSQIDILSVKFVLAKFGTIEKVSLEILRVLDKGNKTIYGCEFKDLNADSEKMVDNLIEYLKHWELVQIAG